MNNKEVSILFIDDLTPFSRSFQRYKTLENISNSVDSISWSRTKKSRWFFRFKKITWKLSIPIDENCANKKIKRLARKNNYNIIWIEKGNVIKPRTLRFIKNKSLNTKLISLSEDDMYASHNHSMFYCFGLKYYDFVFTTKKYNLKELGRFGAKRTVLFLDAYDETLHRRIDLTKKEKQFYACNVGFIGTFEKDRAEHMLFLAQYNIKVVV